MPDMHEAADPVLGFDVGSRRIGVAVGNVLSGGARELAVVDVRADGVDWPAIERLVRDWNPSAMIVGDPLQLDEDAPDQPARQRARRFAADAGRRFGLPVWLVDERHSSQEATRRFAGQRASGGRRRRDAMRLDAGAAVVIVERWLAGAASATAAQAL